MADNDTSSYVSQGLVTFNCNTGDEVVAERRADDRAGKFGTEGFNGDEYAHYHIHQWGGLVVDNANIKEAARLARDAYSADAARLPVSATFNGYHPEGRSMEEIEQSFTFVGFAASPYTYGEVSQVNGGVAAIVQGSFSTRNTGTSTWHPGMRLMWRAWPMRPEDKPELDRLNGLRRRLGGIDNANPLSRYPVRLEECDLNKEVRRYMSTALRAELDAASKSAASAKQLLNFSLLSMPDELAKLGQRRARVMRKIYDDLVVHAGIVLALGNQEGKTVAKRTIEDSALSHLVGTPLADGNVASTIAALRVAYGLDTSSLAFADDLSAGEQEKVRQTLQAHGGRAFAVAADVFQTVSNQVVAIAASYAKPNSNGLIVV